MTVTEEHESEPEIPPYQDIIPDVLELLYQLLDSSISATSFHTQGD